MPCSIRALSRTLALAASLGVAVAPAQEPRDTGMDAYLAGDHNLARQVWEDLALEGDPRSTFFLGLLHYQGIGSARDTVVAAQYFRRAAEQEFAPAQFFLGLMYRDGDGVEADPAQSARWLARAAMAGHRHAQYLLGIAFLEGNGIARDDDRALAWLRRAASQGSVEAAGRLERMGAGQARTASLSPNSPAGAAPPGSNRPHSTQNQRDELFRGQQAFIGRDYRTALEAWRPLAESGMAEAQYGLGFMLESGWGIQRDLAAASEWYRRAAEQGHAKAQFNLGRMYLSGQGVEANHGLAVYWIQSAADNGEARAAEMLRGLDARPGD